MWEKPALCGMDILKVQGKYFPGVSKTANQLIGILDVNAVLEKEN